MEITDVRVFPVDEDKLKAFVSIVIGFTRSWRFPSRSIPHSAIAPRCDTKPSSVISASHSTCSTPRKCSGLSSMATTGR